MDNKIIEIITLLRNKTLSNKADWQKLDEEAFYIDFAGSRIIINNYENSFQDMDDSPRMLIYNRRNEVIYTITDGDNPNISELFYLARDNYYNISETFDQMLDQLRDPDLTIGDLPF